MEIPTDLSAAQAANVDGAVRARGNQRLALKLGLVALFFAGFGFGMVPLYDVICRMVGIDGRTNAVASVPQANTQVDESRWIKVEFLSHAMPGVGLEFKPEQFSMMVHPGAVMHTTYTVRNTSGKSFTGQAIPSVTPAVVARHFEKIECFCFTQQAFAPGEQRTMPITFVVKPELRDDLRTVTLSYTFFEITKPPKG